MKTKRIALTVLTATVLSLGLAGCGDNGVEVIQERVTQGKHAGDVMDKAKELDQQKADRLDSYLE